jgi:CRISPR/Cas system CSM-associated protein Csm2 small subunit
MRLKMNNMSQNPFDQLKIQVQEIIDLIAQKQNREANNKLTEVSEALDELLDHSDEDEDLIEISKYQVLLNQLFQKINPEDEQ